MERSVQRGWICPHVWAFSIDRGAADVGIGRLPPCPPLPEVVLDRAQFLYVRNHRRLRIRSAPARFNRCGREEPLFHPASCHADYAGLESLKLGRGGDRQLADFSTSIRMPWPEGGKSF